MKIKKILYFMVVIAIAMLSATAVHATALPWLDFGNNLIWDAGSQTLSDGGMAYVNSITYKDASTVPPPFPPIDTAVFGKVSLSLSFDGVNNDTLSVMDRNGTTLLLANLAIFGPAPDPLSLSPNPYTARIEYSGLSVTTGVSQWADEFLYSLDTSLLYPAVLNISWLGGSINLGNNVYKINANGKIAPIPEPGTLALLGSGLLGTGFYARRRKKRA